MKLLSALLGLAVFGAPLFVIVAVITSMCWWLYQGSHTMTELSRVVEPLARLITQDAFMAIPLFIGAGAIMTEGGLAKRLVDVARAVIGWMPGGLAVASVISCMFFAAISGSSPVTLIAVGSIMYPALVKNRYPENFSLGLIMTAGSLGCLIPPAIAMLIYAISVQGVGAVDPSQLFIAGLVPAFIISGALALYSIYVGIGVDTDEELPVMTRLVKALGWMALLATGVGVFIVGAATGRLDWREAINSLKEGIWALMLPILVLGGIYGGLYVPSEAGAVAVVYSLIVTVFIYRELDWRGVIRVLANAGKLMGLLILIIGLAFSLNDFLAAIQIDVKLAHLLADWQLGVVSFLLLVNVVLIVLGALMDSISATLIFAPILAPLAVAYDIHPLHFGVIFVVNMEIGYLMPPVATNLFVAAAVFKKPFGQVAKAVVPTLTMTIAALALFMYVPTCSMGLVNINEGKDEIWHPFPWGAELDPTRTRSSDSDPGGASAVGDLTKEAMDSTSFDLDAGASTEEIYDELENIYEAKDPSDTGDGDESGDTGSDELDLGGEFLEQFEDENDKATPDAGTAGDDDDDVDDIGGSFLDEYGND
jgi:C4-dicarboxylate transporter DctM subunit